MYAHFYQLAENPFNLTPDPKFHYINESTREAMASILHGIKARKGFITLIGEAGTGKTTLLKRILDEIEGETQVVFVFNPGVSFEELLEFICMELGVSTDGRRRLQLIDRLNAHLLEQLTKGRNVVVMIDEAQTLDDGVLEELRLLSNLETAKEKILQILLSGQPELEEKLRRPNLRQLRQRIAARATLKPMRPEEVAPYVETRLRSAGAERNDFFTPPALRKVWQASRGIPRVVNVVCDNAMMIAFAEGKRRITSRVVSEAIRDLHGQGAGASLYDSVRSWVSLPAVRYAAGAALGLALVVPFAMSMSSGGPNEGVSNVETPAPVPVQGDARPGPSVRPEAAGAAAGAGAGVELPVAPSAGGAPAASPNDDVRMNGTLRDSMKRAEAVARSTAARLYHSDMRDVGPTADRELREPAPDGHDTTAPAAAPVEEEAKALASLDEPVKFERDSAPLAADPTNDDKGLASLHAPLGEHETGAFAAKEDANDTMAEAPVEQGAAASAPTAAAEVPVESNQVVVLPAVPGNEPQATGPEPKPVKAGSVELEAAPPSDAAASADRQAAAAKLANAKDAQAASGAESAATNDAKAAAQAAAEAAQKDAATKADAVKPNVDAAATESLLASAEAAVQARERAGLGSDAPEIIVGPVEPAGLGNNTASPTAETTGDAAAIDPDASLAAGEAAIAAAAAPPSGLRTFGVDQNEPIVGQLVRVLPGDTVWDIAVAYYGTAGPVTLKRILNSNPTIRDPRHLEVGMHIYLPFQRPEQMVLSGEEGSYRILLAVSPDRSRFAPVRAWVESFIDNAQFTTSSVPGGERSYQLHLVSLRSREAAVEFANEILLRHDQRRQGGRRSA